MAMRYGFFLLVLFLPIGLIAQTHVFAQLSGSPVNTTGWSLSGSASVGNVTGTGNSEIIVCPAEDFLTGSIFYNQPIDLSFCTQWTAEFDFRIFDGTLADGLAFCFLDVPPSGPVVGGGMGIPATANGLKVCFDPNPNCFPLVFEDYPKIEIRWGAGYDECWAQPTVDNSTGQLGFIRSNTYNHARITYDNGAINVYVNNTLYVSANQPFNFSGYLGFTAATGAKTDNHSIKNVVIYTTMPTAEAGPNQTMCSGQTIGIGASPDLNNIYNWLPSNGVSQLMIANPGITLTNTGNATITEKYFVQTALKTSPGCFSQDSVIISVLPAVFKPQNPLKLSICPGQTLTFPSGRAINTAGTYADTLRNVLGCDSIIYSIIVSSVIPLTSSIDTTVRTGTVYVLPSGRTTNVTGVYHDTIRSAGGCDSLIIITNLTVLGNPISCSDFGITNKDTLVCTGTQIPLYAKTALSYNWTPVKGLSDPGSQNPILTADSTRIYTLTSQIYTQNLVVNGDFEAGNTGFLTTYTYCNTNNCLYPLANNGYSVGTNANFFHTLFQGQDHTSGTGNFMIVNGADPNLVVWRETVSVTPNTDYAFGVWLSTLITVNTSKVRFSINGVQIGQIFNAPAETGVWEQVFSIWNSGASSTATIEIVDIFDQASGNDFGIDDIFFAATNSCSSSVTITVPIAPDFHIIQTKENVCSGDPISFEAITDQTTPEPPDYRWTVNNITAGDQSGIFTDSLLKTGDLINCMVTSSEGCSVTKSADSSIIADVAPAPSVGFGPDQTITIGDSVELMPTIDGQIETYLWSPATGLSNDEIANPYAKPLTTMMYTLTVHSIDGCVGTGKTTVNVSSGDIRIPNAFSPNGDGENDVFYILGNKNVKSIRNFSIFNRFGQKVFGAENFPPGIKSFGWDGFIHGKRADAGTYVYYADIEFIDGKRQIFKGTVVLVL